MNRRERLRWRIARLVNLLPGQCWADLVDYPLRRTRVPWAPNRRCRESAAECGSCYCGKVRVPLDEAVRAGVPARAAAGAQWLDGIYPTWADRIDLAELDMAHPHRCVLGQLYGVTDAAPVDLAALDLTALGCWTVLTGPDALARALAEQEYELLDAAWERLILARRGGAS